MTSYTPCGNLLAHQIVRKNEIRSTGPSWNRWPANLLGVSYVTDDGGFLCVTCANGGNGSLADTRSDEKQWRIIGAQTNDYPTECAHCGRTVLPMEGA